MKRIKLIIRYLKYLHSSKTKYKIHSPFVYDILTNVFEDKQHYAAYDIVNETEKSLLQNNSPVEVVDFGALADKKKYVTYIRKVKKVTRKTRQPKKMAFLLFRLVNYFKPKNIVELGTSVGLSSLLMSLGSPQSKITTIEGCANLASIAETKFNKLGVNNVDIKIGNFDVVLPKVLKRINTLDFVFFDGNHRKDPTIKYFRECLPVINNSTVFVFDDIHWSHEMEEAWEYIRQHSKVTVTIDVFYMGLVFFKKELSKQDFIIRF